MMPALGRGIQVVHVGMQAKNWPNVEIMPSLYFTEALIIAMLLLGAWKYGKLKHAATWLAVAVNIFNFFLEPLGRSEALQSFLKMMIRG